MLIISCLFRQDIINSKASYSKSIFPNVPVQVSKIHILKYYLKTKETLIEYRLIKSPSRILSLSFFLLKCMWILNNTCSITYQQMWMKHLLGSQPHPPAASPVRSQGACRLHCQGQESSHPACATFTQWQWQRHFPAHWISLVRAQAHFKCLNAKMHDRGILVIQGAG